MPYCPQCRGEFVEGVKVCPDCEVELVAELAENPDHPDYEYETLTEAQGKINTRLIVAELEAAGIPYVLSGDALGTVHVYPAHDSKISVPKRFLTQAQEIVDSVLSPMTEEALAEETTEDFYCDSCGAKVSPDANACPECGEPFDN